MVELFHLEPGTRGSLRLTYGKAELLETLVSRLNSQQAATVPAVIRDLVRGRHQPYVREQIGRIFTSDPALALGMRYSVLLQRAASLRRPPPGK